MGCRPWGRGDLNTHAPCRGRKVPGACRGRGLPLAPRHDADEKHRLNAQLFDDLETSARPRKRLAMGSGPEVAFCRTGSGGDDTPNDFHAWPHPTEHRGEFMIRIPLRCPLSFIPLTSTSRSQN
jgi:hypothetical protein